MHTSDEKGLVSLEIVCDLFTHKQGLRYFGTEIKSNSKPWSFVTQAQT
jgi:hypothetical protein